jgi:hypothetical protein
MVKITFLLLKFHRNTLLLVKNRRLHNNAYAALDFLLSSRIAAKL